MQHDGPSDATIVAADSPPLEQPTIGVSTHLPRISTARWSIAEMIRAYPSFKPVPKVSALAGRAILAQAIEEHERRGTPLVIVDYNKHSSWPHEIFTLEWLLQTSGDQQINVRNMHDRSDHTMTLAEFVEISRAQKPHSTPGELRRLYWKDADCPLPWREWLLKKSIVSPGVLPGSRDDYLGYLSASEAVESLLCYMGIGDTYTAAHKDLCCSSGHNLMCFAEENASSYWFMTAADDASAAARYFHKELKQELDWETHVTSLEELGKAPFPVYVVEQCVGDLILVPPRSCHQVVNSGGLAMKTSWSRMTLDSLKTALHSELPIYRRVCRPEQYRVKTVIYRSMLHLTHALQAALSHLVWSEETQLSSILDPNPSTDSHLCVPLPLETIADRAQKLRRLVGLFDEVLRDEYANCHAQLAHVFRPDTRKGWTARKSMPGSSSSSPCTGSSSARITLQPPCKIDVNWESNMSQERSASCNLACDFCGADIFQSFFECKTCQTCTDGSALSPGDGLLICPACYVEGRLCECGEMEPVQCRSFDTLLSDRNEAARVLNLVLSSEPLPAIRISDIHSGEDVCIFEAACALRDHRQNNASNSSRCRYFALKSHPGIAADHLRCVVCHSAKCFRHLLYEGTHSAEAVLEHRLYPKGGTEWHIFHRKNQEAMKHLDLEKMYFDLDCVSAVTERLKIAALSFPKCRPGHPKVTLGFYDNESEPEDKSNVLSVDIETTTDADAEQMVRDSSPLTSFTSGSEQGSLSGHSQRKKTQERQMSAQPPPTESSAALPADEMDIIEVEYSDSDIKPRTVLYVYVPPMPKYTSERKRTFSSSGGSTQHVRKKPKSIEPSGPDHVHSEDDSPPRSRVSTPDDAPSRSDMDAVVADNRSALQLAAMLQQANDNRPVFSEVRPIVQKAKCKPVSVVQDIEDTSPPPISKPAAPGIAPDMNLAYPDKEDAFTPSVSGVATTSSLNTSGRTLHPPLPRTTTTKRVRATALPESDGPTSGRTTTVASADAGPAAKRRKGPPGIPLKEMAKRRGLDQDEGTSATKTKKSMAAVPLPHEGPSSRTLPRNGSDSRQLTANVPAVRQALSVSGRGSSTKRPQGSHATQSPAMYLLPAANTPQSSAAVCAAIASAAPTDDAHPQSSAATTKAKGSRTHEGSHSQPSPPESSAVTVPSTSVFTPVLPQPAAQVPSKPDDPAANLLNAFQAWVTVGTTASIEASRTQDLDKRLTKALESSAILSSAIEAIQSEQASQTERLVALQEKYAVQEAETAKMREQIQQMSHALARVNLELKETSKEGRLTQVQLTAERARTNGLLLEVEQKAAQLRALTEKAKEESAQLRALDEKVVHLEAALATSQVPPGLTRENVVELVSKMLDAQKAEVAERQPAMSTSGMIFTAMPIGTPMRAPSQELQQNTSYCQPQGEFSPPNYPSYANRNDNHSGGWNHPHSGRFPHDSQGHPQLAYQNRNCQAPHRPIYPRAGPHRNSISHMNAGPQTRHVPQQPGHPRVQQADKPYDNWYDAQPEGSFDGRQATRHDRPSDGRRNTQQEVASDVPYRSQRDKSQDRPHDPHRVRDADRRDSSRDRHRDSSSHQRRRRGSYRDDGQSEKYQDKSRSEHRSSRPRDRSGTPQSSRHRRNAKDSPASEFAEPEHRGRRQLEHTPPSTIDSYPSPPEHDRAHTSLRASSLIARGASPSGTDGPKPQQAHPADGPSADERLRPPSPSKRESPAYVSLPRDRQDPREKSPRRSSSRALDDGRGSDHKY